MHTTEIKAYRKIANGLFAIDILCCGEHEHPHTVGSAVMNNSEALEASIATARKIAAQDHEAAQQLDTRLKALVGSTVKHQ